MQGVFTYVNAKPAPRAHPESMQTRLEPGTAEPRGFNVPPEPASTAPLELTPATIRLWQAFIPLSMERRRWALTTGRVETARAGDAYQGRHEVAVVVTGCLVVEGPGGIAGDILGPGAIVATGTPRPINGLWLTDGELFRAPPEDWQEKAGHEGLLHLLTGADERRAALERRLHCASTHRATSRVADALMALQEAGQCAKIRMSQQHLGQMLGLRRTTVNSSCRELEEAAVTHTRRGSIHIVDPLALDARACGCRRASAASQAAGPAA